MQSFEVFIPIVFFLSVAAVLFNFIKARHAERIAIIEKGLSNEQLAYFKNPKIKSNGQPAWTAKIGVMLIGVGLAILIGSFFPDEVRDEIILGFIFLLPGIGLFGLYFHLDKKVTSKNLE